ncbi:MAG: DUF6930 domain-containing protein [Isosphaeraceae bacterium]
MTTIYPARRELGRVFGTQDQRAGDTILAGGENNLKLGKGMAFVKSQLHRLCQEDETWEADFRTLPEPISQSATHYVGMVLTQPDGFLRAEAEIDQSPTVNDLATLLAHAMKRPLVGGHLRPRCIHLRGNPRWKPLIPTLKELGIEVVIKTDLPKVEEAFGEFLGQVKEARSFGTVTATAKQAKVETIFPVVARYVRGYGYIEIGDQEGIGFVVRAIGYGGLVFEDDKPNSLAEAMAALEHGLARWFKDEGLEET